MVLPFTETGGEVYLEGKIKSSVVDMLCLRCWLDICVLFNM